MATKARADPKKYGFSFDKDGEVKKLNPNIFARRALEKFPLVYHPSGFFYIYSEGVYKKLDENELARKLRILLHSVVANSWTPSRESSYIGALRLRAKRVDDFDKDTSRINFLNGIMNLETLELETHSKEFFSTIQIPIKIDFNAKCPIFDKFIYEISSEDRDTVKLLAEVMGLGLTTETRTQKAIILKGEGANGKSTLIDIIRAITGEENVSAVPLKDFESSFRRLGLVGKTLNLMTENEFGKKGFQTQHFKQIVSGDLVMAEVKGGEIFEFKPTCKLIFAMNRLPQTQDRSLGFKRRLIIVEFEKIFIDETDDPMLNTRLMTELAGIVNFALKGLRRLRKNNYKFTMPERSKKALEKYFDDIDPIGEFVREKIVPSKAGKVFNKDLFKEFSDWMLADGEVNDIKQKAFIEQLKSTLRVTGINFNIGKSGGNRYIEKIKLKG